MLDNFKQSRVTCSPYVLQPAEVALDCSDLKLWILFLSQIKKSFVFVNVLENPEKKI